MTQSTNSLGFIHQYQPGSGTLTLLLLHGTGGDETALLSVGRALAPNANLLSPRGRVPEGTQNRFFRRLREGVFDIEDLIARAGELAEFVTAASAEYGFDPRRVVGVGYSNGANMAGALLLLHPGTLAGAVLLRPMVPLEPETPPDLTRIPVLITAGRFDELVPVEQVDALAALLTRYGADVTLRWENVGHGLAQAEFEDARAWLAELFPEPT